MALDSRKYEHSFNHVLRDIRPLRVRLADSISKPSTSFVYFLAGAAFMLMADGMGLHGQMDFIFFLYLLYFWWLASLDRTIAYKMPFGAKWRDKNNMGPGRSGKAEGILYLGNVKNTKEEVWFTNSDARTHFLYLGTTGAGKTEGLKSMVTNALSWGSGFVYVDGKADTDLWSSLSSLCRRFGRDDDLLVLNYMTGNSDTKAPSNTMNPFSSGNASYLTNMLVSLMPDAEGDNAMWKERAVSLVGALMPVLTWKRDYQDMPLAVGTIRDYLGLNKIIGLSREEAIPVHLRNGLKGYLDTLPGFVESAFDDKGQVKPPGPNNPPVDTTTCFQQHGYLSMQFTRSLQSLADDYGYIFDAQAADVDMLDIVLNRRILIVLIPALEKSNDEIANLGKIVASTIKGMMGSTLGATVEGESSTVIDNKPTRSATPFMTVFDEVGYYTAQGMAVMAAQARSLGFSLVFSGQDLPAMKKRVREEAQSITANCNIKIFGKLEDPTETKDFFKSTVGEAYVTEVSSFQSESNSAFRSYYDSHQASIQIRPRASYDGLKAYKEGEAAVCFGDRVMDTQVFYCNPGFAKAMRVTRFMILPPPDEKMTSVAKEITTLRDNMYHKSWTASRAEVASKVPEEVNMMKEGYARLKKQGQPDKIAAINAIMEVYVQMNPHALKTLGDTSTAGETSGETVAPAAQPQNVAPPAQQATELPEQPAAPPVAPKTAPPAAGGNPMGFFKNTGDDKPVQESAPSSPLPQETAPPSAQQPSAPAGKKPVDWQNLMAGLPATEKKAEEQLPASKLDAKVQKTLKKAGEDAKKKLLGGGDHSEAAE